MESPDDTLNGATHTVTGSWPSSANPLYTRALKSFAVGDTVTTSVVPLVTPDLLAAYGVQLNVDLYDNGDFTINDGSVYPTTEADNCSTYATFPGVFEYGIMKVHQDLIVQMTLQTMGWGIHFLMFLHVWCS